jgi:hypothetical protein
MSFCLYLHREAERKITACLYVGEGSEYRPFQIFDPFARPLTWGGDLKSGGVCFQTLLLHKIRPQASKRPLLASYRPWSNALSGTLGPPRCSFLRNGSPSDDAQERLHQRLLCVVVALAPIDRKRGLGCFQSRIHAKCKSQTAADTKTGVARELKRENKTPVSCRSNCMNVCIERSLVSRLQFVLD